MKRISMLSLMILFTSSLFAHLGPPWTGSNFGYNYIFRAIDFPANQNNTGYACGESLTYQGDGIVMKTTNGGTTWTQMWTGAGRGVEGACFTDTEKGYIAGWPKLGQGWSGFAKTTDGGATWTSVTVTNNIYFYTDVVFKDFNHGILVGQTNTGGGVWVTSNGGASWSMGTGVVAIPQHACYISGSTYFLADNDGHIQKSTDDGQTWTTVWNAGVSVYILGIDHYDDNTIMACGDNGIIVVSNDGGGTWTYQQVGTDIWHDFAWDSPDHVFVCGTPGLVFESWDGGVTWQNANPTGAGGSALYECIFTTDYHGFICGSQGVELRRDPGCIAGFTSDITTACTGKPVAYSSQSWGNITSYNWIFQGGTPPTSTSMNPVVTYAAPGAYNVRLTVSNPWWTDFVEIPDYISVAQTMTPPVIVANDLHLSSNSPVGNQWYVDGNAIAGATGQFWDATVSGNYWDVLISGDCVSDTSNNILIIMTGTTRSSADKPAVSPIPNHGRFTVYMPGCSAKNVEISIYTTDGLRVWEKQFPAANEYYVDAGAISAGLYYLTIKDVQHYKSCVIVVN